jgi:CubicO group peptidase (beta-lactamase class C family)
MSNQMYDTAVSSDFCAARLECLADAVQEDIRAKRYAGAVIMVGRHGQVGLLKAMGTQARSNETPLAVDSVFNLLSLTKGFTNVLVFRAIEQGRFALTTKVSEVISEFAGKPREDITVADLLTHRGGLPGVFTPVPGMKIDRLDEVIASICKTLHGIELPGVRVEYSPMASHALLGELVRRTDHRKRSFREILTQEILVPLRLADTSLGVSDVLRARHVVPDFPPGFPAVHPGHGDLGPHSALLQSDSEMPWVGMVSTASDVFRFAEMLRRGGELDGTRIIGPRILDLATRNWTEQHPNQLYKGLALSRGWKTFPAFLGLGFTLRGDTLSHHQFGTLASPRTFGSHGAGSTLFWVDPVSDVTFVCLTAGIIPEADNIIRFQRLSDIAHAAAI